MDRSTVSPLLTSAFYDASMGQMTGVLGVVGRKETNLDTDEPLSIVLARPRGKDRVVIEEPIGNAQVFLAQMSQRRGVARHVDSVGETDGVHGVVSGFSR